MGKFLLPLGFLFCLVVLCFIDIAAALSRSGPEGFVQSEEGDGSVTSRKSKFFPYFILQFPNDACTTPSGSGVCVASKDCRANGGTSLGHCAKGFGTCCRSSRSCTNTTGNVEVRLNGTDLTSGNRACRFVLPRGRGICQVRLDFNTFEYGMGLTTGNCDNAKISVSGATNLYQEMNICGNVTGQHLYLTYGTADNIYINSTESQNQNDTYTIRVSYIRCNSRDLVPSHCTQYYTGNTGQVRSLNFPNQQLNNQDYTVCVQDPRNGGRLSRQTSTPMIEWGKCEDDASNFFISGAAGDGPVTDPTTCTKDYVQVFGGHRQCGNSFVNQTVVSGPYLLRVRFDEEEMVIPRYSFMVKDPPTPGTCDDLSTTEMSCFDDVPSMCKCSQRVGTQRMDVQNTGFCLAYKITV